MARVLRSLGTTLSVEASRLSRTGITHPLQAGSASISVAVATAARKGQRNPFFTQSTGMGSDGRGDGGAIDRTALPGDIPFAVKGLSHIAIAVPDLSAAADHYHRAYGAEVSQPVEKADQGVTVVFVRLPNVCIELIHPLGEKSTIAKFLQKNPKGGIHHICLGVDDINAASSYLGSTIGMGTVGRSSSPTEGAEGKPILFMNPKDNHGVLIELQQESNPRAVVGRESGEISEAVNG